MALKWENYYEVAQALAGRFPDADLFNMDVKTLTKMVNQLEGWEDAKLPPDAQICDAIVSAWIEITDTYQ